MFGRVAKIPISNTINDLVGMDFVDYVDHATFLHIQDTFSRFSVIIFLGTKKKERTNGGNGERKCDFGMDGFFSGHRE